MAELAAALEAMMNQMMAQQNALNLITNRLEGGAPAVQAVPTAPVVPAVVPRMETSVKFEGLPTESVAEWVQLINRKAAAEAWTNAQKRQAAIGTLGGNALTWQDCVGTGIAEWDAWLTTLRNAFEVRLSVAQWEVMVE